MFKLDDKEITELPISSVCVFCKHLLNYGLQRKCKAFEKIPDIIWNGKNKHLKPLPSQDNDIVFEEIEKK